MYFGFDFNETPSTAGSELLLKDATTEIYLFAETPHIARSGSFCEQINFSHGDSFVHSGRRGDLLREGVRIVSEIGLASPGIPANLVNDSVTVCFAAPSFLN